MAWTTSDRVMTWRRRSVAVDVGAETLDGWRRHQSGRNASVLSLFSFLSIFPLLLVATTILGFVLEGNEDLQQKIVEGAFADIPVIGQQLVNDPTSLTGNVWVLLVGLATALWSATKAFVGLHHGLDDVWEIDVDDRASMPVQRGRALLGIVIVGGAQIAAIAISAVVSATSLPYAGRILLILVGFLVNVVILAFMYRLMTSTPRSWQEVGPGAMGASVAFSLLQHFGTTIVQRITSNASDTYGQFALVLGLITWLGLLAIATLMGAELNAALVRRQRAGRTVGETVVT